MSEYFPEDESPDEWRGQQESEGEGKHDQRQRQAPDYPHPQLPEPAGARPVIVEDGAFVGGGAGLYEGVTVGRGAVIGAGTVITGQSRVYDLVHERVLQGMPEAPLVLPPDAVVVPGTRPAGPAWAQEQGLAVNVPLIVKYRDAGTNARVALEDALR